MLVYVCDDGVTIDARFCFFNSLDLSLSFSGAATVFTFGFDPVAPESPLRLDEGNVRLLVTPTAPPIEKTGDVGLSPPVDISPSSSVP